MATATPTGATPAIATPATPNPAVAAAANAVADELLDAGDDVMPPYPAELEAQDAAAAAATATEAGDETPAAEEAAPAEGEESPAEGAEAGEAQEGAPADEAEVVEEEAPAQAAPATPAEDPKAIEARKQEAAAMAAGEAAYAQWEKDFAAVETALADKDFDPLDADNGAQKALKVVADGMKILRGGMQQLAGEQAEFRQERAIESYWQDWAAKNPEIGKDRGQKLFQEELQRAKTRYPGADPGAVRLAASERWESRLKQIRAKAPSPAAAVTPAKPAAPKPAAAKPAPAKPAPAAKPAPKDGGRVTPRNVSTRPPAPKPKTEEETYASLLREVGSVSGLVGD